MMNIAILGMRLPPPPPPAAFFAANPSKNTFEFFSYLMIYIISGVRMPPNIRPPFPPNVPPPISSKLARQQPPNVFSAPPSLIAKPPQTSMPLNPPPVHTKPSMTFEAKPQIRYFHSNAIPIMLQFIF
jgi:hypothetical protein